MLGAALLALALLVTHYSQQIHRLQTTQRDMAERAVANAADQIERHLNNQKRLMRYFVEANAQHLSEIAWNGTTPAPKTPVWKELEKLYPGLLDFTIANDKGVLLLSGKQELTSADCQTDIDFFAQQHHQRNIYLHTTADGGHAHYDLLEHFEAAHSNNQLILVLKVRPDPILEILRNNSPASHTLLLLNNNTETVELSSADVATNHSSRSMADIDLRRIAAKRKISGTRWQLQDEVSDHIYRDYSKSLINRLAVTFLGLLFLSAFLLWRMRREEQRRLDTEEALLTAREELESQVSARTEELLEKHNELEYLVAHDPLTGLLNRREFETAIVQTLDEAHSTHLASALCYVDLDRFKTVNDTAGHAAGDELLRQLSIILKRHIRQEDRLARLGGDEFGLILHNCSLNNAATIAEKLRNEVKQFKFSWQGMQFEVGASVGIVPITDKSENAQALLSAADAACYAAKKHGRNQVHLYAQDADQQDENARMMKRSQDVAEARNSGRLLLYCQPIKHIAPAKHKTIAFETLVRMLDRSGNLLQPAEFVHAAERFGHMPDLDYWVTEESLKWLSTAPDGVRLNVNLSGQTLSNPKCADQFEQLLNDYGDLQQQICFEITETAAVGSFSQARDFISRLRQHGCGFALDDYGSGVCSFSYLRNLPVDSLKIDGELIQAVVKDPVAVAMVSSISRMAKAMKLRCIAEFIENEQLLTQIQAMGIEYGQGYYIGKPAPLADLTTEMIENL